MIKVVAYRDLHEVDRAYTNHDGRFDLDIPAGSPVTVRFDTHETLTNAREWHPSVVANQPAEERTRLDRMLIPVGQDADQESFVDALCGYQFALLWARGEVEEDFGQSAAARLSTLKIVNPLLNEVRNRLEEAFTT
jgi:hypothetical protein